MRRDGFRRLLRRAPVVTRYLTVLEETRAQRDRLMRHRKRMRARLRQVEAELENVQRTHASTVQQVQRMARERDALSSELEALRREWRKQRVAPSFVYKLEESKRRSAVGRQQYNWRDPIWQLNAKDAGYEFARAHGLRHPEVLWRGSRLDNLQIDQLPERFTLKPCDGTASRGVWPLIRLTDTSFRSLFGPELVSWKEIDHDIKRLRRAGLVGSEFLIEELISRPGNETALPYDWKLYCFNGRVELTMQKDPRGSRRPETSAFKFYDRAWQDLGAVRYASKVDGSLPLPNHPDALLKAAEQVSAIVGRPFVRVDLFDTPSGVVFGELTPHPGGDQWYGSALDERLGAAWEAAEVELQLQRDQAGPVTVDARSDWAVGGA